MARRTTASTPCGLVQVIRLHWGKAARGGEGARARRTVPEAFEVPAEHLTAAGGSLCLDISHWGDRNAFASPFLARRERVPVADGFTFGCVSVSVRAGGLRVRFVYDQTSGGAPDRSYVNTPTEAGEPGGRTFDVGPGEWVRVAYNGRFSCIDTGSWWYEQVVVNVAWFTGDPDGRVFTTRRPSQELRAIADLR